MSEAATESHVDKVDPGIEIEFGQPKQKHRLVFTLGGFAKIERLTGKNMLNGEMFRDMSATSLAMLLWAGTLHEKSGTTWEDMADQITLSDLAVLPGQLQAAFEQASPPQAQKKTSPEAPQAETSTEPIPG